jgi:hypothetical protein
VNIDIISGNSEFRHQSRVYVASTVICGEEESKNQQDEGIYQKKYEKYKEKYEEAKNFKLKYEQRKRKHMNLKRDHEQLQSYYDELERKYEKLRQKYRNFKEDNETVVQELQKIKEKNKTVICDLQENLFAKEQKIEELVKRTRSYSLDDLQQFVKGSWMTVSVTDYDAILSIDSLKLARKFGWTFEKRLNKAKAKDIFSIVGFLGLEKSGKTFTLNKLCGLDLPKVNTKGLSIKYKDENLICIDTEGFNQAVDLNNEKLVNLFKRSMDHIPKDIRKSMIEDKVLTELFIEDFLLSICEVIILVVGPMKLNEQKMIERISEKIALKQRLIIVHNFKNDEYCQDVERRIKEDILQKFDVVVTEKGVLRKFIETSKKKELINISHLVLGKEKCESGTAWNSTTLKYLKTVLETSIEKKDFDLIKSLKTFVQDLRMKKKYFNDVIWDEEKKSVWLKQDSLNEKMIGIYDNLGDLAGFEPEPIEEEIKREESQEL